MQEFHKNETERQEFFRLISDSGSGNVFQFYPDFTSFHLPSLPLDDLQKNIIMSLKSHEIIILTFFELQSAERNIRNQIEKRDSWIREYKQITESNPDMAAYLYFGIPDNRGRSDVRYKSIVENIKIANDDAIFFGEQLHSLLAKRGKLIKKKYGNRHWRVTEATWKKAFKILFPSSVSYQGYVEMTSKIKDNELIF